MEKRNWLVYIWTYLGWATTSALGFWLLLVSRQVFTYAASRYVGDDIVRGWQVRYLDKVFLIVVAVFVLAISTLGESYLRKGIERRDVFQRFTKLASVELLVLFVFDLVLVVLQGAASSGWWRWLILVAELVAGLALLFAGRLGRIMNHES